MHVRIFKKAKRNIQKKKYYLMTGVLICIIFGAALLYFVQALAQFSQKEYIVILTQKGFKPDYIEIKKGDLVTFKTELSSQFWPASDTHPSHALYPSFDPKKPLSANEAWTFKFEETGKYPFHDHLSPRNIGLINVIGVGNKAQDADCMRKENDQSCWDKLITDTLRTEGFERGFALFDRLYKKHPEFAKDCHDYSHTLGREAYRVFFETKSPIPKSPIMSSCGYGFFHGFLEILAKETNDPGKIRDFCDSFKDKGKKGQDYLQCYHGIGHGAVSRHENSPQKTSTQEIINEAIVVCEMVDKSDLEMSYCTEGIYGPAYFLFKDESDESRELIKKLGVLAVCPQQDGKYRMWCYNASAKFLVASSEDSLIKAMEYVRNIDGMEYAKVSAFQAARSYTKLHPLINSFDKDIDLCVSFGELYKAECIRGLIDGVIVGASSGKENLIRSKFCENENLTSLLRKECNARILEK